MKTKNIFTLFGEFMEIMYPNLWEFPNKDNKIFDPDYEPSADEDYSSDEESHMTYKCATIFTEQGDAFVTDILFKKMLKQWKDYHESLYTIDDEDETEENNLIL